MSKRNTSNEFAKPFRRFAPTAEPAIDTETGRATFVFNTEEVGRDGHIVRNAGIRKSNFELNPVILFAHDDRQPPIGRATSIRLGDPASKVEIEFTPRDLYPFGATIGDMVKARYLNACSESWQPIKWRYMTDRSGVIFEEVDLLEISIVPIPALPDAVATARAAGIDTGPLVEWAERLLDSGGIATMPRSELETLRRAAKMPAPTKVTTTDPDKGSVSEPPASQAAIGNDIQERSLKAKHKRALERAPKVPTFKRGLYQVANLASLVESLGYAHDAAEWEAETEGDMSAVPGMLGEALVKLGEALIAMTAEEVKELLEAHDAEDEDGDDGEMERILTPAARAFIADAKTPQSRAWRRGVEFARAGRSMSVSNQKRLQEADGHHDRAMKHHRAIADQHGAIGGHLDAAHESHERMTETLSEVGVHVRAAQAADNPKDHLEAAARSYRAAEKHAGDVSDAHSKAGESREDLEDSHQSMGRSLKRAQGAVRSVLETASPDDSEESEEDKEATERAAQERKAREARATRARELAKKHREPTTID